MSCRWPAECLPEVATDLEKAKLQVVIDMAVHVLWVLSGRRFGCCPVKVRPCRTYASEANPYSGGVGVFSSWFPVLDGGVWRNEFCGCGPKCRATGPNVIHLRGPVCDVIDVTVDGVTVDPGEYRLQGDRLYRLGASWPEQNLNQPLDEPGTWSVTYTMGNEPPAGAGRMVGLLARELWKSCCGDKCRLPARTTSVSRQGVSISVADPEQVIGAGFTGIPEIDLWLGVLNPNRLQGRPVVVSPEFPEGA